MFYSAICATFSSGSVIRVVSECFPAIHLSKACFRTFYYFVSAKLIRPTNCFWWSVKIVTLDTVIRSDPKQFLDWKMFPIDYCFDCFSCKKKPLVWRWQQATNLSVDLFGFPDIHGKGMQLRRGNMHGGSSTLSSTASNMGAYEKCYECFLISD